VEKTIFFIMGYISPNKPVYTLSTGFLGGKDYVNYMGGCCV